MDRVLELRRRYRCGPCKIKGCLKRRSVKLRHNTVHHLCQAGLNKAIFRLRKTWGTHSFEWTSPNDLWQAGFKLAADDHWILSVLDY